MENTFPPEIWLEIFKTIKRQKLMKLRLVCKEFYDLIEEVLDKSPEWKSIAVQQMLFDCAGMTMQRAYPYDLVTHIQLMNDAQIWRGTYLSFKKWQKIVENSKDFTRYSIVPVASFGKISCFSTFDKYIAIVFENGTIANYTTDDVTQPFYLAYHKGKVVQIEYWYSNGEVLVVSTGEDNGLKFWDLKNKIEIATNGLFASNIHTGECRHFCIGEMDGLLTSYERTDNHITAGQKVQIQLRENQTIYALVADGKMLAALSYYEEGTIMYLLTAKIENGKLVKLKIDIEERHIRLPEILHESIKLLIAPTVSFFFAIGEQSIGSTIYGGHEWDEYNLSLRFGCSVKCVALHAQILMFGLEDGSLHLLHIENYGQIMDLERRIYNSRKIQVDTEPIFDITVMEVDKIPRVLAMTEHKVHIVNFIF